MAIQVYEPEFMGLLGLRIWTVVYGEPVEGAVQQSVVKCRPKLLTFSLDFNSARDITVCIGSVKWRCMDNWTCKPNIRANAHHKIRRATRLLPWILSTNICDKICCCKFCYKHEPALFDAQCSALYVLTYATIHLNR